MKSELLTLSMRRMVRYAAGRYEIECGPGDEWRWTNVVVGEVIKTHEDAEALAAVATAAALYLRSHQ